MHGKEMGKKLTFYFRRSKEGKKIMLKTRRPIKYQRKIFLAIEKVSFLFAAIKSILWRHKDCKVYENAFGRKIVANV